jgi:uncharacterized phage protein (TIGR01671 family)
MRTIKFKAWDTANKKWLSQVPYLEYLLDDPEAAVSHHDIDEEGALFWYPNNCLGPDHNGRIKYLQFTGLKDKNNKEIYEGDIVEINFNDGLNPNRICRVEWGHHGWELFYKNSNERPAYYNHFDGLIIIGNIFENPELLK